MPFEDLDDLQGYPVAVDRDIARFPARPAPVVGVRRIQIDGRPEAVDRQAVRSGDIAPVECARALERRAAQLFGQLLQIVPDRYQRLIHAKSGRDLQTVAEPVDSGQSRCDLAAAFAVKPHHQRLRANPSRIEVDGGTGLAGAVRVDLA